MAEKVTAPAEFIPLVIALKRRGFDIEKIEPLGDGRYRITAVTNTFAPKFLGNLGDRIGEFLTALKFGISRILQIPSEKVEIRESIEKISQGLFSAKYRITAIVRPLISK